MLALDLLEGTEAIHPKMPRNSDARLPQEWPNARDNVNCYDIALTLRYSVRRRGQPHFTGTGRSVNLSRSGLVFQADTKLLIGDAITLTLDWPATATKHDRLYLVLGGAVVGANGSFTAAAISRTELVRAREFQKCFDGFMSPAGSPPGKRPVVLVDEDDQASAVISAIVAAKGGIVKRVQPGSARRIFKTGIPPVMLIVTQTVTLLESVAPGIPVILTLAAAQSWDGLAAPALRPPRLAILRKPLIYGELRDAVHRFSEEQQALKKCLSA